MSQAYAGADVRRLQQRLRRTWPAFFARHGNFTPVQLLAIPPLLAGRSALIMAATAAGKTEAAVVPLLERHLARMSENPALSRGLRILYISPTRALTSDLYARLSPPLHDLNVTIEMKTGDTPGISFSAPPALLLTTPESTDSLLTRAPRLFVTLDAVILDEIHLFDGTPRGDHLRCLLARIEQIRAFHAATTGGAPPLQRVALSATVADPAGIAARVLGEVNAVEILHGEGRRDTAAELALMTGWDALIAHLVARADGPDGSRKTLIFCNARNEVEQTATELRQRLPFHAYVGVHYSNLDPEERRRVETDFVQATTAFCVCTSTLELGIDIGSVDDIALLGAPPSVASFLQRMGRGGRRTHATRVLCLYRSQMEALRFAALIGLAEGTIEPAEPLAYRFRLSVLVQQIFSRLKQSPTGAVRPADIARLSPVPPASDTLRAIFAELVQAGYLRPGRVGEWRPGPALDELLDNHEIYSNIGSSAAGFTVIDAFSGQVLAKWERQREIGEIVLLGGRTLEVVWVNGRRMGVRPCVDSRADRPIRPATAPFALPLDVSRAMAVALGLEPHVLPLVALEGETLLFHFWGELYGALLARFLQQVLYPDRPYGPEAPILSPPQREPRVAQDMRAADQIDTGRAELDDVAGPQPLIRTLTPVCMVLPGPLLRLPAWHAAEAQAALHRLLPRFAPYLDLGRFHALLPAGPARDTEFALCDLPRFERLYRAAAIRPATDEERTALINLLRD